MPMAWTAARLDVRVPIRSGVEVGVSAMMTVWIQEQELAKGLQVEVKTLLDSRVLARWRRA